LVISPWAKHAYLDHTQYEFASLLRLAEENFNLPTLRTRDVSANDMMNSFDFSRAPQPVLIEPADFVGPAQGIASITQRTTGYHTNAPPIQTNSIQTYLILALIVALAAIIASYLIWRRGANH
jgi:phospholipase C